VICSNDFLVINHEILEGQENNPLNKLFQSTSWDIRSTYHTTLQVALFKLVFGREMIHMIVFVENWG
jgi:hypothetical protein